VIVEQKKLPAGNLIHRNARKGLHLPYRAHFEKLFSFFLTRCRQTMRSTGVRRSGSRTQRELPAGNLLPERSQGVCARRAERALRGPVFDFPVQVAVRRCDPLAYFGVGRRHKESCPRATCSPARSQGVAPAIPSVLRETVLILPDQMPSDHAIHWRTSIAVADTKRVARGQLAPRNARKGLRPTCRAHPSRTRFRFFVQVAVRRCDPLPYFGRGNRHKESCPRATCSP
jgi:hypothetical protein